MRRHSGKKTLNDSSGTTYWMYGRHAVSAALNNPERNIRQLLLTANAHQSLNENAITQKGVPPQIVSPAELQRTLPSDAVHQGIAAQVDPLPQPHIDDIASQAVLEHSSGQTCIIVLDQVSDPHNVGAILRSAAAFGAKAVITSDRHSPKESAALAKTASGALENVPLVRVNNIADNLKWLKIQGFWCLGLDADSDCALHDTDFSAQHVALVMGAEGKGIRPRVIAQCDLRVHIPMQGGIESLNVSAAAAVALYHCRQWRRLAKTA